MFQQMTNFRAASSVRSQSPLSESQLRNIAPSVFAQEPHDSRSSRYAYIPTSQVLLALQQEGFEVFGAMQARCRSDDRRDHTKHLLRLRHIGDAGRALNLGDAVSEICLLNSHDGSSSYQMFAGVFRLACLNGLMVCDSTVGAVRIPHSGKALERVIHGAYDILDGCNLVKERHENMSAITLTREEQDLFASTALTLRYDDETKPAPIQAAQLLNVRRREDKAPDLWTTFNVVQENIVRGGVPARTATNGRTRTREIKGIDQNVKINKALWMLADGMAKLKMSH